MKRFLAFGYDSFYPAGGREDFVGEFDTALEALAAIKPNRFDYLDILDTSNGEWLSFNSKPDKSPRSRWERAKDSDVR